MKENSIPERKYVDGPKKMVSWRLPEKLMAKIDNIAKKKGWTTTDLITTVLDRYIQEEEVKKL
jgi:predicted DNA-binding protein